MTAKTFLLVLICFLAFLTGSYSQYSCFDLPDVEDGQCCAGGKCCHDDGEHPACCCDLSCFQYRDCCIDIAEIECEPPQGETLPDFCSIYSSLYTCTSAGHTNDCCIGSNCTVSSPSGDCCSCDKDCHIPSRQDCCTDIDTIGCTCNNTCGAHYFSGCCAGGRENCRTTCSDHCYCDEQCHNRGDCCSDIEDIGCRSPLTVPPPVVCKSETYMEKDWPDTYANFTAYFKCPNENQIGNIYRMCGPNGEWNNTVVNDCKSAVLNSDLDELTKILNGHVRLTVEEQNKIVHNVTVNAINASSAANTHLFPQDVSTISTIVSDALKILVRNLPQNESESSSTNSTLQEGLIDVIDNLLDARYEDSWNTLRTTLGEGGISQFMGNIEEYGRYSGQFLMQNATYSDSGEMYQTNRTNINVTVNVLREGSQSYNFASSDLNNVTKRGSVALKIDAEKLLSNGSQIAVVNSIVKNVGQFLNSKPTDNERNVTTGSDVITAQVYSNNRTVQTGIVFNFTTKEFPNATKPRCVFWDYQISDWSDEGVETLNVTQIGVTPIIFKLYCRSSHTTPFVVLVDSQDVLHQIPEEEYIALEVFSYIGVSISSICLIISIIFLMMLGKELITGVQFFIHFNLSIALLAGYLIYLFLIDDKIINMTNTKIGCGIVAGILHYFFLAAFSWMLCEGIMLFLMLVLVFSTISKRWYIFLIIGWGLPVIPVAISAGIIHDAYGVQGRFCWLDPNKRGATWAFLGPMIVIILINIFFLVLSVRALFRYHSKSEKDKDEKKKGYGVFKNTIIGTITLIPLLGVTWLIGVFSVNAQSTVFAWLFVICASSQGIVIFLINIVRNQKIRDTVMKKCCPKLAKKKKNESVSRIYRHSLRERRMSRMGTEMMTSIPPVMEVDDNDDDELVGINEDDFSLEEGGSTGGESS